jgi:hypothetical protein
VFDCGAQRNVVADVEVIPRQQINEASERMCRCAVSSPCLISLAALTSAPPDWFQLPYLKGE